MMFGSRSKRSSQLVKNSQSGQVGHQIDEGVSTSSTFELTKCDGKKKIFKRPETEDKISEMSFKNFAVDSKCKIRWAVNLYDSWCSNRMKEQFCPHQIVHADLSSSIHLIKSN